MDNKNKKVIIFVVFVIAFMAVAVFLSVGYKNANPTPSNTSTGSKVGETSLNEQTGEEMDKIISDALNARNAAICEQITREDWKQHCLNNVLIVKAGDTNDKSFCFQIKDELSKANCLDNLIISKAVRDKNSALCDEVTVKSRVERCRADAK